jgi:dTDP-4-dehydrorhamnose 3,5-epimerase
MKVVKTALPDVLIFEPTVHQDARGYFYESFNQRRFAELAGCQTLFVQDNQARSVKGVLRGLHYQIKQPQAKLVRVLDGEIFDVAVDLRRTSPTFGKWIGVVLSAAAKRQLWIPEGFAHGYLVLSDTVELFYKVSDFYAPEHERTLMWNDPTVAIAWPALEGGPILSDKDRRGLPLGQAEVFA